MNSIEKLFPNKTMLDVLSLFIQRPDEEMYQAAIAKETGKVLTQVQRTLMRLEEAGLITKQQKGNRAYYRANRNHPAFEDIKRTLFKTVIFGDAIRKGLENIEDKLNFAFIFGSVASGREQDISDIDLFLVGDLSLREISDLLASVSNDLDREINPTLYSKKQLKKQIAQGNPFIVELLENPIIWLIGDQNEFKKMVK